MHRKMSLTLILVISIAGMLFSGYLSFGEVVLGSCPVGGCSSIAGIPTCVYGFVMYMAIFIISLLGILSKN
jgi:uncharacterized membrane protein